MRASLSQFLLFSGYLLARSVWQQPRFETVLLLSGLVVMVAGLVHDFGMRQGMIDGVMLWTPIIRSLLMVGLFIFPMQQHAAHSKEIVLFSTHLQSQLQQKEQELREAFEREQRLTRAAAIEKERERITLELHDGVASQLATIVALSEKSGSRSGDQDVQDTAKYALKELRLVIDTLSSQNNDLHYTLASFREYCLNPVEKLGIEVDFSVHTIPTIENLTQQQSLNIVRILQEGLNNAVRHGQPKCISLHGEIVGQRLRLILENHGGYGLIEGGENGYGLGSIRKRVEELGGVAILEPIEKGARLMLEVPFGRKLE